MKYCPFCGSANEDGYRFCTGCGKKMNGEASSEAKNYQPGYWPAWKDAPADRPQFSKNSTHISESSTHVSDPGRGSGTRIVHQPWEQDPEDFLKQFDEMYYSPRPHSSANRNSVPKAGAGNADENRLNTVSEAGSEHSSDHSGHPVPNNSENSTAANAVQSLSSDPAGSGPFSGSNRTSRREPMQADPAYAGAPAGNAAAGSVSVQRTSENRNFTPVSSTDPVAMPGHISNEYSSQYTESVRNTAAVPLVSEDKGGFGWWILGFLLPLAGLVIYLSTRKTHPRRGHSAAVGALVMLILVAVMAALFMFGVLKGLIVLV